MSLAVLLRSQLDQLSLGVPEQALEPLLWILEELLRWNRRINLTAITDPREVVEKHLIDSLTLLPLLQEEDSLLDVGSGAGFPVLPVKLALRDLDAVSVEAVGKKIAFQKHVVRSLGLTGLDCVQGRIEELGRMEKWRNRFDVVVARAFAPLHQFSALALPCLRPGGRLIAMKGPEGERELADNLEELTSLGLETLSTRNLRLPASGAERCLLVLRHIPGETEKI